MTEKYTPADGDPVDMSQFTLGPRYSSEDMYRDMGIVPGSRVAFEKDGVVFTDTVQSVTRSSAEPEIVRRLSWWQRIVPRLTPKRYRKSLVVRRYKPATVSVETGPVEDDVLERHQRLIADMQKAGEVLTGVIHTERRMRLGSPGEMFAALANGEMDKETRVECAHCDWVGTTGKFPPHLLACPDPSPTD